MKHKIKLGKVVRALVDNSIGDSVRNLTWFSVENSMEVDAWIPVWKSIEEPLWDIVWGYGGSTVFEHLEERSLRIGNETED